MRTRTAVVVAVAAAVATLGSGVAHGATVARLPLGDGATARTPTVGTVLRCEKSTVTSYAGSSASDVPWIDTTSRTWTPQAKVVVQGTARWSSALTIRTTAKGLTLTGNGLPSTPTGTFPVQSTDPAYRYDQRPGWIADWMLSVTLPATPKRAASASCIDGIVGYSVLGVPIYSAVDAAGHDAVAGQVVDRCGGRPTRTGRYHFRTLSPCFTAPAGSDPGLFGYALDGYGIYAEPGATTASLDACHGRTSVVTWHGTRVSMYHYVATDQFPYLVGCFRGTPATLPAQGLGAVE